MRAISLLYHDAIVGSDFDASGFTDPGAEVYKLDLEEMRGHFRAIALARADPPSLVTDVINTPLEESTPWLLTFDDGGVSAALYVADLLDEFGWLGHFFITAGRVGTSGFLERSQIRDLRRRGHMIGSHSWSHPFSMSSCSWDELVAEWGKSASLLSEMTGEATLAASVPRGNLSAKVAQAAAHCGIRALFSSEPRKKISWVGDLRVFGRYTLVRGASPKDAERLASSKNTCRQGRQFLWWNVKKAGKMLGGRAYHSVRERLLSSHYERS